METTPTAGLGTIPPAGLETTPYAGLVTRAIALIVDAILINVIALIAGAVIALIGSLLGVGNLGIAAALTGGFLWLGWTGLYFIVFWIATGQTPGARLLGIRVVSAGARPLGIVRASLRFVVMMLALIPLGAGFLTVLFDDRRRGPHDMVADTVARWAPAVSPALAESPAPAHAPVAASAATAASPSLATAPLAAAPPTPATAPSSAAASPAPAAAPPPTQAHAHTAGPPAPATPVVGEVVGPARDDEADGRVTPAAQAGPRFATEQRPPTRFESRPGA
jgi:uncharacterized RDD family membrane protein YckC